MKIKPMVLIILDGFGYRETAEYNAIRQAKTPNLDDYFAHYPHCYLSASSDDVGLPHGQMGNSEVGHLNIGCGRSFAQDLTRIDQAIESGHFYHNPTFLQSFDAIKKTKGLLHIFGLLSDGGIHSHIHHIAAIIQCAEKQGISKEKIRLHAFLDGRDTPPQSALPFLQYIEQTGVQIASIMGRYYAMDRDQRWERTELAYNMLTLGQAPFIADNAQEAVFMGYSRGESDEFIQPTLIKNNTSIIENGDSIIFMNFRSDRARQLTMAFMDPLFHAFARKKILTLKEFISLTEYKKEFYDLNIKVAFQPNSIKNSLGEILSRLGKKQLRIAETEKYPHVTFFFNGGLETPYAGEDRILIPSPKVATYDLKPEMSAYTITEELSKAIYSKKYDVIICNYANADMVGHTGNIDATIKAIEVLDSCIATVIHALKEVGGEAFITADHGNAECMFDHETDQAHTAHTSEPVPFLYIGREANIIKEKGVLADVAPTVLSLLDIPTPDEMTGEILLKLK